VQQFFEPVANTTIFIETAVIVSLIFYGVVLLRIAWFQSWLTNQ